MFQDKSPEIIYEIGLNHLGSTFELKSLLSAVEDVGGAVTIQIRESVFYERNPSLALDNEEIIRIRAYCRDKGVKFGFALGILKEDDLAFLLELKPDFIKLLSMCSNSIEFMELYFTKNPPRTYVSNGKWSESNRSSLIKLMRPGDAVNHTKLTHDLKGQQVSAIRDFRQMVDTVGIGVHCKSVSELICLAMGVGIDFIFIYIGDKSKKLPDFEHCIDITELKRFERDVLSWFSAIYETDCDSEIKFVS